MTDPALAFLRPAQVDAGGLPVFNPANGNLVATVRGYDVPALTAVIDGAMPSRFRNAGQTCRLCQPLPGSGRDPRRLCRAPGRTGGLAAGW